VYVAVWPGCSLKLNLPSKNCVAQCSFRFGAVGNISTPGLRNVTVVPTGTVRVDGIIDAVNTLSPVEVAVLFERAIQISLAGTMPAAVLSTGRRMLGMGKASGASWLPFGNVGLARVPV